VAQAPPVLKYPVQTPVDTAAACGVNPKAERAVLGAQFATVAVMLTVTFAEFVVLVEFVVFRTG